MELLVVGCSHRSAPLHVRESVAFAPDEIQRALHRVRTERVLDESMILSTCNRTEIYGLAHDTAQGEAYVRDLLCRLKGSDVFATESCAYTLRDAETVRHLFRVAAGLDSMRLGEMQILNQVKRAFQMATEGGAAGVLLHRLLTAALHVGKRVRTETEIGAGSVSVASAAVDLAAGAFGALGGKRVLVVGAGETGRLVARHFAEQGPASLVVANRTLERAREIATELGGRARGLEGLETALAEADVAVCATGAPGVVVTADLVRAAMRGRAERPLVLIDIAVPHDVDAAAGEVDGVTVHGIDALQSIVDVNLARRKQAVPRVEAIVDHEVARFGDWLRGLQVTPTLVELRERFEAIRTGEVERHLRHFTPAERAKLDALTRGLVNKLLHLPTLHLKSLDLQSELGPAHLDAVRELFGLNGGLVS